MKKAFIIGDKALLRACLGFADILGLSVDHDNLSRNTGEAISIGTSKKYKVAGNADPSFYSRKHGITPVLLDKTTALDFIQSVLDLVTIAVPAPVIEAEVEAEVDEITLNKYNHPAINLLYAKVKGQKKSPKNYYVIDNNGEYSVTTDSTRENLGNLAEIFAEINAG
jgi:hypothetical protein